MVFGKQHTHVLRDIANLLKNLANPNLGWLKLCSYVDQQGKERPSYEMTRDGFTLLAMGFTGEKALKFKIAYIERFNAMEAALSNPIAQVAGDPILLLAECITAMRRDQLALEERVVKLELRDRPALPSPESWYTTWAYARMVGKWAGHSESDRERRKVAGCRATRLCTARGIKKEEVNCRGWSKGTVGRYPESILREVWNYA